MTIRHRIAAIATTAVLAAGLGVAAAAPASANPVCEKTSRQCGTIINLSKSQCATNVFGGWNDRTGSKGQPKATLRPGQNSGRYFKDTDGMNGDNRCTWYRVTKVGYPKSRTVNVKISSDDIKISDATQLTVFGVRR